MRKILVVGRTGTFQDWRRIRPKAYKHRQLIHIGKMMDIVGRHANQDDLVILLPDADPELVAEIRRRGFIVRTPPA